MPQETSLTHLLQQLVQRGGSDLHLTPNSPPRVRLHGKLRPLPGAPLRPEETKRLAYSAMTDEQKFRYEETKEIDFSFGIPDLARFRVNAFAQRGSVAAVLRLIPHEIRPLEKLGLPLTVNSFCSKPRGLILVTGPSGSGKSTTLAAMIDKINGERDEHIITIEDPIEFVHTHKRCLVNQREVGADTASFSSALRTVLREDPNVVLIGEMRDLETIEATLRVAETGHLTLATLHTNSAPATINRIIDVFPAHQQSQIRSQLSMVLEGILCQTLIVTTDGQGRVPATEILVPNAAIRNLIRENKIHQIYSAMQTGQEKSGMHTLNQSLAHLYLTGKISYQDCVNRSANRQELQQLIDRRKSTPTFGR